MMNQPTARHLLVALAIGIVAPALAFVVAPQSPVLATQQPVYTFNGVEYVFPSSYGSPSSALTNDGAGNLTWQTVEVADVIVWSAGESCPPGWTEYTPLRGRYVVGLPAGGTLEGTIGTALTDRESRPVGQHTHAVTDPGHTHVQDPHGHTLNDPGHAHAVSNITEVSHDGDGLLVGSEGGYLDGTTTTGSSATGVSVLQATGENQTATTGVAVQVAGSVVGTNAPYIQLIACRSATP